VCSDILVSILAIVVREDEWADLAGSPVDGRRSIVVYGERTG
jgi:hypothetical protein